MTIARYPVAMEQEAAEQHKHIAGGTTGLHLSPSIFQTQLDILGALAQVSTDN